MNSKHKPTAHRPRTIEITETNAEKLYRILLDRAWHCTRELVKAVSHTFAVAKFYLQKHGYNVEKRRHPEHTRYFQYRLGRASTGAPSKSVEGFNGM